VPVILVVNKIDLILKKEGLLPLLKKHSNKMNFSDIVPISSLKGDNIEAMNELIHKHLPVMPPIFPEEQVTDRSERFLAAEIVREKLMRQYEKELPYSVAVEIEQFSKKEGILNISAIIWVEREGQKRIIIGKKGEQLKNIGQLARYDMQRLFDKKIFLQLWVKVKEGWSDDERSLRSLGYSDEC
jgi:GTP-binding protein Era